MQESKTIKWRRRLVNVNVNNNNNILIFKTGIQYTKVVVLKLLMILCKVIERANLKCLMQEWGRCFSALRPLIHFLIHAAV